MKKLSAENMALHNENIMLEERVQTLIESRNFEKVEALEELTRIKLENKTEDDTIRKLKKEIQKLRSKVNVTEADLEKEKGRRTVKDKK